MKPLLIFMNIFGLYVYLTDKTLVQKYNPEINYPIDDIIKLMNLDTRNYAVFENDNKVFHVLIKSGKIYVLVTVCSYPKRVGLKCLEDMDIQFAVGKSRTIDLKKICTQYNRLENVDSISNVNAKVEQVKSVMHENINKALENTVKLESIELQSQELMQSAGIFSENAKELKKRMWWKNMKMKLMFGTIILVILGIIVGVSVGISKSK